MLKQYSNLENFVDGIYLDDKLKGYLVDVVLATETDAYGASELGAFIRFGASPRATVYLHLLPRQLHS